MRFTLQLLLCCCALLWTPFAARAQKNEQPPLPAAYAKFVAGGSSTYRAQKPYYLVAGAATRDKRLQLVRDIDGQMAIVTIPSAALLDSLQKYTRVTPANDGWKYSPALANNVRGNRNSTQRYVIVGLQPGSLEQVLRPGDGITILATDKTTGSLLIQCTAGYIADSIASKKEVIFIDAYIPARREAAVIGYNRSFHGINQLDFSMPGANGKNIIAGVKEQRMDTTDLDVHRRVITSPLAGGNTEPHATAMATLIGGAGNSFYDGRGVANGCRFFPSSFANLFADDAAILNQYRVSVQNHSYGTIPQQFYGAEALSYDVQGWQQPQLVHVFSAGNRGTAAATEGRYAGIPNYANLTGNFKMAKNIITVAAVDEKGNIAAASSAGPAYDGRLVPQLTALGPNGTSDAAAIVSGTVAVLQQVYKDSNSQLLPAAALVKALLVHTADDIYKTGIDYKTGYGFLNSFEAVKALRQKQYDGSTLAQNQVWTKNITVPANAALLKITLAWTDTAATVNNSKALVNDLDMELLEVNTGAVYKPWVLSIAAHADSLAKPALRGRDTLNTIEQVTIALPAAGVYQLQVKGTRVMTTIAAFNIVYSIDTLNTFAFTSPQHTADVNRQEQENLFVKWRCFVADTNQTGNLFISYNNGGAWELVKQNLKIYTRQYLWPVKDTASTAVFKMETSFGSFLSKNFIISPVAHINVDFLCVDSFQLSWNKHVYANAYRLYALTDSAYLKPLMTVTDTFHLFKRAAYPYLVYAVEPLLSNGIPAARSIALDIEMQAVNCFYRALNYTLENDNRVSLALELSFGGYADSVYFERVTAAGQLLRSFGGQRVNSNLLFYYATAGDLQPGASYFKARIQLKSGAVVYTNIIEVLTSGNRLITFYPNPAASSQKLNYITRQGLPPESKLVILDGMGRVIKSYASLPGSIDLSRFGAGLYIYQLLNENGQLIDAGKLVIVNR